MGKVWKWILGIVIVLVVVAALAGLFFLWRSHPAMVFMPRSTPFHGQGFRPGWSRPDGFAGGPGPLPRHRFLPFFGGLMLIAGLVKLAFFGALLYGAYWLGKRNARLTLDAAPGPRPPSRPAAPAVEPDSTPKRGRKVAKS
jgi:hypothetical protein